MEIICWLLLFGFQVVALWTVSLIPAARAWMWLTPRVINILPIEACQLYLLMAAWGNPLTMIHGLKLRTICSLGEFLSQGEEGSFHSCSLSPSKVYGKASNKPQNLALIWIRRHYPPYALVSMGSFYIVTISSDAISFTVFMMWSANSSHSTNS